jgi:RimJ/RimL family protein N-acetyltransferase
MKIERVSDVRLRPMVLADLPRLYQIQLDPELNRMAMMIPRTEDAFFTQFEKALADASNITRAILFGGELVGGISCFPVDGQHQIGYFLDRAYWGQGIASQSLRLLLDEVTIRPLFAAVAVSNAASVRVLQKCGFVVDHHRHAPANGRYLECEEVVLTLAE